MDQEQPLNESVQRETMHEAHAVSLFERIAFSSSIAASISVLGVGMISIGSLFSGAIDMVGYMLLTAHWILRVLIVVGGFALLVAILYLLIPKQQVTITHMTHALHVLAISTATSAFLVFVTFLIIAMR